MTRVASIGECMVELRRDASGLLRQGFSGDTFNMAVYLKRSAPGLEVSYVTAVGRDSLSEAMLWQFRAEGIDCGSIVRLADRLPGLYLIETDDRGERRFLYWRGESAARALLDPPHGPEVMEALRTFDLVFLSGISLAIPPAGARGRLLEALAAARRTGTRVAFDPNHRRALWPDDETALDWFTRMLRIADISLPSFSDEGLLFGDRDPQETAARHLAAGPTEVVVKNGKDGCLIAADGAHAAVPAAAPERVVDTTSAGDSFNGAYIAGRLSELEPTAAARRGAALAATVIAHPGAIIDRAAMPPGL